MISSQHTQKAAAQGAVRGSWPRLMALLLLLLTTAGSLWAQGDKAKGEALFKSNCVRCHNAKLEKPLTGPALYKVQERIPGGDWIYNWIANSPAMIASGDAYAVKIFNENAKAQMDPFPALTKQDVDDILAWIAAYEPAASVTGGPGGTDGGKKFSDDKQLSSMRGWVIFLLLVVVVLLANISMLVAKSRGIELFGWVDFDRVNAWLFLLFYILMVAGFAWCVHLFGEHFLFDNAASEHGDKIDTLFWVTMAVVVVVFLFTNLLLFFFAFRYFRRDGRKAHYYPENHKLELIWTVVPAIVLSALVMMGIKTWNETMGDPELAPGQTELVEIELNAQQFTWNIRYPGADNKFGDLSTKLISPDNQFGVDFSQPESHDDFQAQELWLPKGKRVNLRIRSRDVLHSAYLPHFRVKMDAVPGMSTRFHFVPTKTTKEMQEILGDTTFYYELACAEVCGKGHFSMQRKVVVVEYDEWLNWAKKTGETRLYDPAKHASVATQPTEELRAENKPSESH